MIGNKLHRDDSGPVLRARRKPGVRLTRGSQVPNLEIVLFPTPYPLIRFPT
jgi:hypothetical protein